MASSAPWPCSSVRTRNSLESFSAVRKPGKWLVRFAPLANTGRKGAWKPESSRLVENAELSEEQKDALRAQILEVMNGNYL